MATEIDQKLAGMIGVFCDMPGHLDVVSEVVDSLEYIEYLDRDRPGRSGTQT